MLHSMRIAVAANLLVVAALAAQTAPPPDATSPAAEARQQREAQQIQLQQTQIQNAISRLDGAWVVQEIKKLQEQQEQLLLDEAGAVGRQRGIELAIDKYTAMMRDRAAGDPVVGELEKVISFREQELKRMMQLQKVAAISAGEVNNAETELAKSRVDLAEAKRRAAGGSSTSSALDDWNREAMNLSIEKMDRHARLDYIAGRLGKLNRLDEDLMDLTDALNNLNTTAVTLPNNDLFGGSHPAAGTTAKSPDVDALLKRLKADQAAVAGTASTRPAAVDEAPTTNP